jgi:hypothetical protein
MTKNGKKTWVCGEQKYAPKAKNMFFLKEKYEKWWIKKFLGHVLPILDDASDPPGHRDTWAS